MERLPDNAIVTGWGGATNDASVDADISKKEVTDKTGGLEVQAESLELSASKDLPGVIMGTGKGRQQMLSSPSERMPANTGTNPSSGSPPLRKHRGPAPTREDASHGKVTPRRQRPQGMMLTERQGKEIQMTGGRAPAGLDGRPEVPARPAGLNLSRTDSKDPAPATTRSGARPPVPTKPLPAPPQVTLRPDPKLQGTTKKSGQQFEQKAWGFKPSSEGRGAFSMGNRVSVDDDFDAFLDDGDDTDVSPEVDSTPTFQSSSSSSSSSSPTSKVDSKDSGDVSAEKVEAEAKAKAEAENMGVMMADHAKLRGEGKGMRTKRNPSGIDITAPKQMKSRKVGATAKQVYKGLATSLQKRHKPFGGERDPAAEYLSQETREIGGQQFNKNFVMDFERPVIVDGGPADPGGAGTTKGHEKILQLHTSMSERIAADPAGAQLSSEEQSLAAHVVLTGLMQGFESSSTTTPLFLSMRQVFEDQGLDSDYRPSVGAGSKPWVAEDAPESERGMPRIIETKVENGRVSVSVTNYYALNKGSLVNPEDTECIGQVMMTRSFEVDLNTLQTRETAIEIRPWEK